MKQSAILVQDQTGKQFRVDQSAYVRSQDRSRTTIESLDGAEKFDVEWAEFLDDLRRPVYRAVNTSLNVPQFTEMFGQRWNFVKNKLEWTDEAPAELARPLAEAVHRMMLARDTLRKTTFESNEHWADRTEAFIEDTDLLSGDQVFKRVQECLDNYLAACRQAGT